MGRASDTEVAVRSKFWLELIAATTFLDEPVNETLAAPLMRRSNNMFIQRLGSATMASDGSLVRSGKSWASVSVEKLQHNYIDIKETSGKHILFHLFLLVFQVILSVFLIFRRVVYLAKR